MMRFADVIAICGVLWVSAELRGSLIADGFVSGSGGYSTTALNNQNPSVPGFTSAWSLGTGSTKFHVDPAANGLTSTNLTYPTGGSVGLTGLTADAGQSIARAVSVPTASTYYMSGIYLRGNSGSITPGAYAFMGFGNSVLPAATTSGSTLQGVYVGFTQTAATSSGGTLDDFGSLVIRSRQNIGNVRQNVDTILVDGQAFSTYLDNFFVVTKLALNTSGTNDTLSYWVNPTNLTSDSTMNSTSELFGSVTVDAALDASSFSQLTFAESAYNGMFSFDEPRIATSLADLNAATPTATPEPASLAAMALAGCALLRRRR